MQQKAKRTISIVLSIFFLMLLLALTHYLYVENYTEINDLPLEETTQIDEPDTFTRCLEASHEQYVEGLLARDQAMHAFATQVNKFFAISWQKITDCF